MSSRTTLGLSAPDLSGLDGSGLKVAVVAAQWHGTVMTGLLDGALRGLVDSGVHDPAVIRVPGSFELPVACASLADHFDALVALGVIIRGGTPHFDYVCDAATRGITDVAVRTKTLSVSAFLPVTMKPKPSTVPGSRIPRRQGL